MKYICLFVLASVLAAGDLLENPVNGFVVDGSQGYDECLVASWDANTEPDLAGYKVYYGEQSMFYQWIKNVGNCTRWSVCGLETGKRYYFAVTAYDHAGNESELSDEVSAVAGEVQTFSKFDLNKDNQVDISDLILHLNDPQDYNKDGETDISDLVLILNEMEIQSYEPEPR